MKSYPEWKLGLIDLAWFGSPYEGQSGRQEAKTIGFDSLDLFIGFDPGRMNPAERRNYVADVRGVDLPIILARMHLSRSQRFQSGHPFLSY